MARSFSQIDDCLDDLLTRIGPIIRLGIPLGIGKPNPFINAFYARAKMNPLIQLRILTALSLEKPKAKTDLEQRFLGPFVDRIYGDYPDLNYVADRHQGQLPKNVDVVEFFLKSGDYLSNDYAQQQFLCSNYTHVARDMLLQKVNVVAQAVAVREHNGKKEYSLSSNPDVTLDLLPLLKNCEHPVYRLLVVNRQLPFMENDAIVSDDEVDAILDTPECTHTLFSAPNMKVTTADYAIGLNVSTLVKDGGTLQIGIGSLGDAISQALIIRHTHNAAYQAAVKNLNINTSFVNPFIKGLYGCSEMFVNGFMQLIEAGILRRRVFMHKDLQSLLNKEIITTTVDENTLKALYDHRIIQSPLTEVDVNFLKKYGIFKPSINWLRGELHSETEVISSDITQPSVLEKINTRCLGTQLIGGIFMHGGFFLGPRNFYEKLHQLDDNQRRGIGMARIGFINQLYGQEELAQLQRKDAVFVNTCMMMTLLGTAVSDGLDSGRLVSGVGGQYNFVSQAHALPDARSILMLRSTRYSQGQLVSNIVWNYGHTTIPRHLRDMVVTEYGIADLRGQTDSEVIKRLLCITDSRFQAELLAKAKAEGKLEPQYEIPVQCLNNLPQTIGENLASLRQENLLPDFPFGNDFTEEETNILKVLMRLQEASGSPLQLVKSLVSSLADEKEIPTALLERLQLDKPDNLQQRLLRQLFIGNF